MTIGLDKYAHFAIGTATFASLLHLVGPVYSMVGVGIVAAGKELYDHLHRDRHTPEVLDFLATIAGGVAAFACTL